jgi:hypothetical protein
MVDTSDGASKRVPNEEATGGEAGTADDQGEARPADGDRPLRYAQDGRIERGCIESK